MPGGIVSFRGWLCWVWALTAMVGCGDAEKPVLNVPGKHSRGAEIHVDLLTSRSASILRVREDALRKRLWVLTLDEVRIYDTAHGGQRLIRNIKLPRWSVVGFRYVCMPDMILENTGSALVSSNGQARLLRIDAERFDLQDYDINFPTSAGRDSGFGALAFGPDDTLLARTTADGLLWKIDIATATAIMIEDGPKTALDLCSIPTQQVNPTARSSQR